MFSIYSNLIYDKQLKNVHSYLTKYRLINISVGNSIQFVIIRPSTRCQHFCTVGCCFPYRKLLIGHQFHTNHCHSMICLSFLSFVGRFEINEWRVFATSRRYNQRLFNCFESCATWKCMARDSVPARYLKTTTMQTMWQDCERQCAIPSMVNWVVFCMYAIGRLGLLVESVCWCFSDARSMATSVDLLVFQIRDYSGVNGCGWN